MKEYLKLNVENYNNFKSNDYILNDYDISDESYLELANMMNIKGEDDEDRIKQASEWFNENSSMNYDLKVDKFYNETISRKDIHVYGTIELNATYDDIGVYAYIDIDCDEMYNVREAIEMAEENE